MVVTNFGNVLLLASIVVLMGGIEGKPQFSSNWPPSNQDDTTFKMPSKYPSSGTVNVGLDSDFNQLFNGNKGFSDTSRNTGWTDTERDTFFKESQSNFEIHEKTVSNIAGIIIGVAIGVMVLIGLGILACCFIPICMCARGSRSTRGVVVHLPPNSDRNATQPLYPVQSQIGAYPAQPAMMAPMPPYGQPGQYPPVQQAVPNMAQPPPYPAATNWSAQAQNKQQPYNPYYQAAGGNPQNPNMPMPPYPQN